MVSTNDAEPKSETSDPGAPVTGVPLPNSEPPEPADASPEESPAVPTSIKDVVSDPDETVAATPTAKAQVEKPAKAASKPAMTPGQRLAAQKAAKAAVKVAQRGREADLAQSRAIEAAEQSTAVARTYVASHTRQLGIVALVVVIALGAWGGVSAYFSRKAASAARLLVSATEAARAEIRSADEPELDHDAYRDEDALTFPSVEARDREALRRYRQVVRQHPDSDAASFAHMAIGTILLSQEKPAEARREFETAERQIEDAPELEARALEGIGITYVEERAWAQANEHFEELRRLDRNRYRDLADYHLARVLFAQNDRNAAKQKLEALIEHLGSQESEGISSPYVQQQAELLLQQIDPSAAPRSTPSVGGDLENLPPEMLEQLLRQFRGGAGGPTP